VGPRFHSAKMPLDIGLDRRGLAVQLIPERRSSDIVILAKQLTQPVAPVVEMNPRRRLRTTENQRHLG
jgi:hypothetical protein